MLGQPPELLTDVERAARFFYLQKYAWSGKRTGRSFRYAVTKRSSFSTASLPRRLAAVAERLDHVQLEQGPYEDVLRRYDRPTTFFYCDPPYVDIDLYEHNLSDEQFEALAARLGAIKGRFLLSINDCPKARRWFDHFPSRAIQFTYTSTRRPKTFSELLFANYSLDLDTQPSQ